MKDVVLLFPGVREAVKGWISGHCDNKYDEKDY